jgi:hypothetical protein
METIAAAYWLNPRGTAIVGTTIVTCLERGAGSFKNDFESEPERYVLREGFPDFPPCPFGGAFSILGFDTSEQSYVWLVTSILKDSRLIRIPYQAKTSSAMSSRARQPVTSYLGWSKDRLAGQLKYPNATERP